MPREDASRRPWAQTETSLTIGFVPSVARASQYLDHVLVRGGGSDADSRALLRQILEAATYSKGYKEIISGFLGDAVSGKHLPAKNGRVSGEPVEDAFLTANRSILDGSRSPEPRELFRRFVVDNQWRLADLPGGTTYDLLDFGFRQSHYIRPNSDAFAICVRPHEDPRWVSHWLSRPLTDRIGQWANLAEMHHAFARVFGAASVRPPRHHFIRRIVPSRMLKWARAKLRPPRLSVAINRGDPWSNESMRKVVKTS